MSSWTQILLKSSSQLKAHQRTFWTRLKNKLRISFGYKLREKQETNGLTIKFEGYWDYLLGNYKLKDYTRINAEIRSNSQVIRVSISEIPLNFKDKNFPPLFYLMKQGEEFDFNKIVNSSILYWYPPTFVHKPVEQFEKSQQLREIDEDGNIKLTELCSFFNKSDKHKYLSANSSLLRKDSKDDYFDGKNKLDF